MQWLNILRLPNLGGLLEIVSLAVVLYYILYFFRGTRAAPALAGLSLLFIVLIVVTRIFYLDALNWLFQRFTMYLAVAILIIFQPEIRRALAEIGKRHLPGTAAVDPTLVDNILKAVAILSKRKIGALIAIEQDIGTRAIQETGVKIDSAVSPELLAGIFFPYTPLHDGGIIISRDRIAAARCIFPLSHRLELSKTLGTRHRAALGLTEETDAVVVIVSEETGKMSCCHKGRLYQDLDENRLSRFLANVLLKSKTGGDFRSMTRKLWPLSRFKSVETMVAKDQNT